MARLTVLQRETAQTLAKELFALETLVEEHSAVLRADPNQLADTYARYILTAPSEGFLPPRNNFLATIKQCEDTLASLKDCVSFHE